MGPSRVFTEGFRVDDLRLNPKPCTSPKLQCFGSEWGLEGLGRPRVGAQGLIELRASGSHSALVGHLICQSLAAGCHRLQLHVVESKWAAPCE